MACRLRNLREGDLDLVRTWRTLPEVTRYMYTDPRITAEDQGRWFAQISASARHRVWIIELTAGDIPVGLMSLTDIDHAHRRACWAYYIADERARGKGLARSLEINIYRYVFEELGFNRLWCEVLAFNDRVVSIHEKFGSKVEGVLQQHICKNGEMHDVVRMAVLAQDWPEIRAEFPCAPIEIEEQR